MFRNYSRVSKYSFFEDGSKEKKTYREVISAKDVPWEVQMDKSGGGQQVGTEWLRKAIHPCNIDEIQAQFPLQEPKWGLWVSLNGLAAPSTCRTEVNHKPCPQKAALGWSFDIFSGRTG